MRIKNAKFFDREVASKLTKAHRKALSRFGAYVRSDARKSMRTARAVDRDIATGRRRRGNQGTIKVYRPRFKTDRMGGFIDEGGKNIRVSRKPSKPGTPPRAVRGHIKRFLFFEFEPRENNVIVGPIWLPPSKNLVSRFPVTAVHEQKQQMHKYVVRRIRSRSIHQEYPQRPYMQPAFQKNVRKLQFIYKDIIK